MESAAARNTFRVPEGQTLFASGALSPLKVDLFLARSCQASPAANHGSAALTSANIGPTDTDDLEASKGQIKRLAARNRDGT